MLPFGGKKSLDGIWAFIESDGARERDSNTALPPVPIALISRSCLSLKGVTISQAGETQTVELFLN